MAKQNKQVNWTKSQRQAIETLGRPVLVTASAGTGKTAVLAGRVVERIADPNDAAQADSVLVLTFTDAAAEEMRSRIAQTLFERCRSSLDNRLRSQLLLLDRAAISTIHAFCKRVLSEFFYMAGLDPAFGVLDPDEQKLLKSEILEQTLEAAWADEAIAQGLTVLFEGRRVAPGTGSFIDRIIPLSTFLDSVVSRDDFYSRATTINDPQAPSYNELKQVQKQIMLSQLAQCQSRLEYAIALDEQFCGSSYACNYIKDNIIPEVEQCRVLLEQDRLELCRNHLADLEFARMPAFKKTLWPEECKDLIKEPIDRVKDILGDLLNFALLSDAYEERIGTAAALQTKVLIELLSRFDRAYTDAKRRRNVLDFADLEHCSLALLKNRPEAVQSLRQRFEYIFVDEYQDINAVQQSILEYLTRGDNLFVVGDIKQSIYGFRQSNPQIFLRQLKASADIEDVKAAKASPCRIDLRENFRCRGEIINFVNAVFSRIMTEGVADMDYDNRAQLVSGFAYPAFEAKGGTNEPVELVLMDADGGDEPDEPENPTEEEKERFSFSSAQRQAAWIARRINHIVGAETGRPEFQVYDKRIDSMRDVAYRDIVILMRSLAGKAREYVEMLQLAGIPVSSRSAGGYFEASEILDCMCLLKVLDNPDRDIELAGLLRSPIFNVTDSQLAKIRLHSQENFQHEVLNSKQTQNQNNKKEKQDRVGFYQAVQMFAANGPDEDLRSKLAEILSQISAWRGKARNGSLAGLLDEIFRKHNLLSFYAALPNGIQRRANLLKLHDHAIQFEHFRTTDPGASLGRFVEFLEKLEDEGQDWAPAASESSGENAVQVMSVHKSKGLEFPVVFVAELNTRFNKQDSFGQCLINEDTIGLQILDRASACRYPSMAHQVISQLRHKADMAEEMRILYVALTRAREKLILTATVKENSCANLLLQCASPEGTLPDWMLADSSCHLEWLLTGLANSQSLHQLYGTRQAGNTQQHPAFHAERVRRNSLDEIARRIFMAKRSLKSVTKPQSQADAQRLKPLFERVCSNLRWRYPHENALSVNAKFSVSELIGRKGQSDRVFYQQPAAVRTAPSKQAASFDAMAVGSAFHAVFESLNLHEPVSTNAIDAVINRLVQAGHIAEHVKHQIDAAAILSFFQTPLGKLTMEHGHKVLREWPFTYALDMRHAGAESDGEAVILQGIVDLIIPSAKGLVIVDFKTDRVDEHVLDEHSTRYAMQLGHYARAASAILRQPVMEAWLYYLTPHRAWRVDLENTAAKANTSIGS